MLTKLKKQRHYVGVPRQANKDYENKKGYKNIIGNSIFYFCTGYANITKEEKIKEDWVNPEDPSKKGDIGHVARTVESEALLNSDSEALDVKVKRNKRDRRTPDGLSVTTGKYKKKNRRTTKP